MKAPPFAYAKPKSLADAFALLQKPGAKILAGGQSLIPSLNMRLSAPEVLIDITGLQELKGISKRDGVLRVGALTTHAQIENDSSVRTEVPLLSEAAPHIAHAAIRNRGTLGGSLALADPAAEYPACAVALQATFVLCSVKGERRVPAEKFFKGLFETDLKPGELIASVEFPTGGSSAFLELTRRHGDYAIVGLAAHESRFVFFGVGAKPVVVSGKSLAEAKAGLSRIDPSADLHNSAATKKHLAGVLLERAWNTLSKPH